MKLSDLFPPDVRFTLERPGDKPFICGPFILLKGELSKPASPPLCLKDMVLARIESVPPHMAQADVLAALLRSLQ
jgi:hypothetical protein